VVCENQGECHLTSSVPVSGRSGFRGSPADIARTVAFLADAAAGYYITGANLSVNGGYFMSF